MRTFTIGEVLNRLKDEFDDITISKIRFLESEGLIRPDRTDSGYRKFGEEDVARLRYVLRAQRDRYLPLRVIKDELDRMDSGRPVVQAEPAPPAAGEEPASAPEAAGAPAARAEERVRALLDSGPTDVQLSQTELCDATGLETGDVKSLRDLGLLRGDGTYDGDDLIVARAAATLLDFGLEPRHLRMFGQFADREVALYQQLITPLLRQRNPDSRRAATEQLDDLVGSGTRLHGALLARELRALLRS